MSVAVTTISNSRVSLLFLFLCEKKQKNFTVETVRARSQSAPRSNRDVPGSVTRRSQRNGAGISNDAAQFQVHRFKSRRCSVFLSAIRRRAAAALSGTSKTQTRCLRGWAVREGGGVSHRSGRCAVCRRCRTQSCAIATPFSFERLRLVGTEAACNDSHV